MANDATPSASSSLLKWACVSLCLFGFVVGVVSTLSTASGTATTLLGLLFALIGGSVVSLFTNKDLSENDRNKMAIAVGLISLGIVFGLGMGFFLKYLESRGRENPPPIAKDEKKQPEDPRIFEVHSTNVERIDRLI
jgi:hypothetical protein